MSAEAAAVGDRHISIDAVRGFAVLGILLMNIVGMGMPAFAYLNPAHYGGHTGADLWTWAINNVLVDGKMRALFTMLFGASAVLIAERAIGQPQGPAQTHYSRMFWLFVIGMLHAYFLWWGDILVCYALAGLIIFPFRNLRPLVQIGVGVVILLLLLGFILMQDHFVAEIYRAIQDGTANAAQRAQWAQMGMMFDPPPGTAEMQIGQFGGTAASALYGRAFMASTLQLLYLPTDGIPEAIGQMFIGMGLFRLGFFTLKWSTRAYAFVIAAGYLMAVPVTAWLAWMIWRSDFEPMTRATLMAWQGATRTIIAMAHASVLLLIIRAGAIQGVIDLLAAAGRMAFSNYLMSSIITTVVFTAPFFALYGGLSRSQLMLVVLGVWVFILAWSKPWLARFHYGPFEWVWRSLVKLKPQPFVKHGPRAAAASA